MMIGKRRISEYAEAAFQPQHYRALLQMWRLYPRFWHNAWRYFSGSGHYPCDVAVRTPVGVVSMRLYSYHDMLTVNEIFCRNDYPAGSQLQSVLDLGSNIGISALFFLTRNRQSRCILYEPDPRNVERLKSNLAGYEDRYTLLEAAVADRSGDIEFGVEASGRYGGIGVPTGESIVVPCVHINDALRAAIERFGQIDILKIDTEGVEVKTVQAIDSKLLPFVRQIFLEANPDGELHGAAFANRQCGSVRLLTQRSS
jgi:FkbM family methyltransferase